MKGTATMDDDKILSAKHGPVGSLIFNNPEKRNAMSLAMSLAAADVLDDFLADDAIRVIVLSGSGDKAFISGGDISKFEGERATPEQVDDYNRKAARFRTLLRTSAKPTIAMIRGYCLGGGMAVALACDLRIAADDARFGIPAAKLGIGYSAEAIRQLMDLAGPSAAKYVLFTGRQFTAAEALAMAIVNEVVPVADLAAHVDACAQTIAGNAPLSILASKRVIDELGKDPDQRDNTLCDAVVAACFASQDYIEGRRAFMERRKPVFTGR